jgi:hypothetical protein
MKGEQKMKKYTIRKYSIAWYIAKILKLIGYGLLMLFYILAILTFIWFMILLG